MKRLFSIVAAIVLLFTTSAPVSANHYDHAPRATRAGSGYDAHVPVCLHSNFGGPNWNLANDVRHQRLNEAMHHWNFLGNGNGSGIYFYRATGTCQSIYNAGDQYVQVGFSTNIGSNYGLNSVITNVPWWDSRCNSSFYRSCRYQDAIWLNGNFSWGWAQWDTGNAHALTVLMHEIGHSIELDHATDNANCTMHHSYAAMQKPPPLCAHEIQSVRDLWP